MILNKKEEYMSLGSITPGTYKIICNFNNFFHVKFILRNDYKVISLSQNIYSDQGEYKFKFYIPFEGELVLKQSLDRENSWTECKYAIVEV